MPVWRVTSRSWMGEFDSPAMSGQAKNNAGRIHRVKAWPEFTAWCVAIIKPYRCSRKGVPPSLETRYPLAALLGRARLRRALISPRNLRGSRSGAREAFGIVDRRLPGMTHL